MYAENENGPVLMTHSKERTCGVSVLIMQGDGGPVRIPLCCCLPNMVTKDASGRVVGETRYVCDACLFVPKWDVHGPRGEKQFHVRPDTCVAGTCVQCKCGGQARGRVEAERGAGLGDAQGRHEFYPALWRFSASAL